MNGSATFAGDYSGDMSVTAVSTVEWVKAVTPVVAALIAVSGAYLVTIRAAHSYEQRRKQREFDRETMQELTSLYGTIFATWKAWDTRCRFDQIEPGEGAEWRLLCEAAEAEGRLEAMLVRLAADRPLRDPEDIRILAGLRQSFKIVRKAIERAAISAPRLNGDPSPARPYRAGEAASSSLQSSSS